MRQKKAAAQNLFKDIFKSDRASEDSGHNIGTELSAIEPDEAVASKSRVIVKYNVFNSHSRGHLDVVADVAVSQTIVDLNSFYTGNLDVFWVC